MIPAAAAGVATTAEAIAAELQRARARTLALADALTPEQQIAQHSPLMSPVVWDVAHVANYEEQWLVRALDRRAAIDGALDDLYDAFVHPRAERPNLPLLGPAEARAYGNRVRTEVLDLLGQVTLDDPDPNDPLARLLHEGFVYGMVIQHEHQHAETLLATLSLMGDDAPAVPGADCTVPGADRTVVDSTNALDPRSVEWVRLAGGPSTQGTSEHPWALDNERPEHLVELAEFHLARDLVTNGQWLAFVEDGGYDTPSLWTEAGWRWRTEIDASLPLHWRAEGDGAMSVGRFGRRLDLAELLAEPVQHVCAHEADAFARYAGARLPTEPEWERAAQGASMQGANLGQRQDGPRPVTSTPGDGEGMRGLFGDVWEWTATTFEAYPGFEAFPYAEYSEVFFGPEHRVLRGGSWATDPVAMRASFRNWDYPIRRQIFCGLRLAADP